MRNLSTYCHNYKYIISYIFCGVVAATTQQNIYTFLLHKHSD
ncbi:hypothetical protein ALT1644_400013 [Alteromonas macleodii]